MFLQVGSRKSGMNKFQRNEKGVGAASRVGLRGRYPRAWCPGGRGPTVPYCSFKTKARLNSC